MTYNLHQQAAFETSKRLLAQIVNEGLLTASTLHINGGSAMWLCFKSPDYSSNEIGTRAVMVTICPDTAVGIMQGEKVVSLLRPESLRLPIVLEGASGEMSIEHDPGKLFALLHGWFEGKAVADLRDEIITELQNSAANQGMQPYQPLPKRLLTQ